METKLTEKTGLSDETRKLKFLTNVPSNQTYRNLWRVCKTFHNALLKCTNMRTYLSDFILPNEVCLKRNESSSNRSSNEKKPKNVHSLPKSTKFKSLKLMLSNGCTNLQCFEATTSTWSKNALFILTESQNTKMNSLTSQTLHENILRSCSMIIKSCNLIRKISKNSICKKKCERLKCQNKLKVNAKLQETHELMMKTPLRGLNDFIKRPRRHPQNRKP